MHVPSPLLGGAVGCPPPPQTVHMTSNHPRATAGAAGYAPVALKGARCAIGWFQMRFRPSAPVSMRSATVASDIAHRRRARLSRSARVGAAAGLYSTVENTRSRAVLGPVQDHRAQPSSGGTPHGFMLLFFAAWSGRRSSKGGATRPGLGDHFRRTCVSSDDVSDLWDARAVTASPTRCRWWDAA